METFVELLVLKKEDHLYFSLSVILFEILANDCSLTPMFYLQPWRPYFFIDGYIIHKLQSTHPKDHSYQVWLNYVQWFSRRISKCKKLTNGRKDDERNVMAKAHPDFQSGELKRGFQSNFCRISRIFPHLPSKRTGGVSDHRNPPGSANGYLLIYC